MTQDGQIRKLWGLLAQGVSLVSVRKCVFRRIFRRQPQVVQGED